MPRKLVISEEKDSFQKPHEPLRRGVKRKSSNKLAPLDGVPPDKRPKIHLESKSASSKHHEGVSTKFSSPEKEEEARRSLVHGDTEDSMDEYQDEYLPFGESAARASKTELSDPKLRKEWGRLKREFRHPELVQDKLESVKKDRATLAKINEAYQEILKIKVDEKEDAKSMGDKDEVKRLTFVINRITRKNLDLITAIELKLQSRFEQLQRHDQHQNMNPDPSRQQPVQTSIPSSVTSSIEQAMHQDVMDARNRRLAISSQLTEQTRRIGAFIKLKLKDTDAAILRNMLAEYGKLQGKYYAETRREGRMMWDALEIDGHGGTPVEGDKSPKSEDEEEELMEALQCMPEEDWQAEWDSYSQLPTFHTSPYLAIHPDAYDELGNARDSGILNIPPVNDDDTDN